MPWPRGCESRGFTVTLCHDGHSGYERAKERHADVIVLDLMLPDLSGAEVCARLRAEGVWTPILVLTARDGASDESDVLNLGADDYLRKPFSYSVLVARCRALLRRAAAGDPPRSWSTTSFSIHADAPCVAVRPRSS